MRGRRALQLAGLLAGIGSPVAGLTAQDRLIASSVAAIGATVDVASFGKGGYAQPGVFGADSVRTRHVTQVGIPVSVSLALSPQWTLDVQTLYSSLTLDYRPLTGSAERSATLSGMSDVRTRVTGRLLSDAVVLTVGANLPTGATKLDGTDFLVLQTASAPAIGLGSPPVGTGPSGTLGLVGARQLGGGALALGVSYEFRGTYQPVAALVAGAPSADFRPGNVTRMSVGYDHLLGKHRLVASAAADLFQDDVLTDRSISASNASVSSVRLGPVITTDVQLHLAVARAREFVLWGSNRFRERFERDGRAVDGSNGNYLDLGVRTRLPLSRTLDLLLTTDARRHSGLAINQGLATARSTSAGATVGLVIQAGRYSVQPYVRGRSGFAQPRALNATSIPFSGASAGLVLLTRF